jgi:hypothetical protein
MLGSTALPRICAIIRTSKYGSRVARCRLRRLEISEYFPDSDGRQPSMSDTLATRFAPARIATAMPGLTEGASRRRRGRARHIAGGGPREPRTRRSQRWWQEATSCLRLGRHCVLPDQLSCSRHAVDVGAAHAASPRLPPAWPPRPPRPPRRYVRCATSKNHRGRARSRLLIAPAGPTGPPGRPRRRQRPRRTEPGARSPPFTSDIVHSAPRSPS